MNPATPKTEPPPSIPHRTAVFGRSLIVSVFLGFGGLRTACAASSPGVVATQESATSIKIVSAGRYETMFTKNMGFGATWFDLKNDPTKKLDLAPMAKDENGLFWVKIGIPGDDGSWFTNPNEAMTLLESGPGRVRVKTSGAHSRYGYGTPKAAWNDLLYEQIYTFYPDGSVYLVYDVIAKVDASLRVFVVAIKSTGAWKNEAHAEGEGGPMSRTSPFLLMTSRGPTYFLDMLFVDYKGKYGTTYWNEGYATKAVQMDWRCGFETKGRFGSTIPAGRHHIFYLLRLADDMNGEAEATPYSNSFRSPDKLTVAVGSADKADPGDFDGDGFNESEGAYVLGSVATGVRFTLHGATTPRPMPVFKVKGYPSRSLPGTVTVGGAARALGKDYIAAFQPGFLLVQLLETVRGDAEVTIKPPERAAGPDASPVGRTDAQQGNDRGKLLPLAKLTKLRVSSNHRYLEDASGRPFFLVGDSPQNLPLKLTVAEFDGYMSDCEGKGFNWLWICIDGQNTGSPPTRSPVDRQGNRMMATDWDIGTLNDKYFATIDAIVKSAGQHGLYCAFTPLSECQWSQANIDKNTSENWKKCGLFLGKRYKDAPNIVWTIGNDSINVPAQHAIVAGLKEAGDRHLMSVNWRPGVGEFGSAWVRKHEHGETWIDLDAWYINRNIGDGGSPAYWQKIEYERADPMPSFNTEAAYQKPDWHQATDLEIRMMNYSIALGGGCGGHVYGAGWLGDDYDYDTYKNNGGRVQTIHFKKLFTSREWTTLIPDYGHRFITAGFGTLSPTTKDYVAASMNGGTLGMAYCPKAAIITADLSKLSGPVKARWYDPTNGKFREIAGSPFPNSGSRDFPTPGNNSTGDSDWVLVLESEKQGAGLDALTLEGHGLAGKYPGDAGIEHCGALRYGLAGGLSKGTRNVAWFK